MQTLVLTEIYQNTYAYVNSQAILSDLNSQNHFQLNVDFQTGMGMERDGTVPHFLFRSRLSRGTTMRDSPAKFCPARPADFCPDHCPTGRKKNAGTDRDSHRSRHI